MAGGHGANGPGCLTGCAILALLLVLLPFVLLGLPFLLPIIALFLGGYFMMLVWQSDYSLRTKQAITGALFYPAGTFYLWRHSCIPRRVKLGAVALAGLGTALIIHDGSFGSLFIALFGLAFLAIFLGADYYEPLPDAAHRSGGHLRIRELKNSEWRRLLEIEEAQSGPERRLLLAREFSRLAETALAVVPTDHKTWPGKKDLTILCKEVDLLVASATDPATKQLPESTGTDVTTAQILAAIQALEDYVGRLSKLRAVASVDLEHVRLLVRERSQLQGAYDRVVSALANSQLAD